MLRYKKLQEGLALAQTKATKLTTYTHITTLCDKAKSLITRAHPPRQAPERKARRSNTVIQPSKERHHRTETKPRHNASAGPQKQREGHLPTSSAAREERIKLLLPTINEKYIENRNLKALGAGQISNRANAQEQERLGL